MTDGATNPCKKPLLYLFSCSPVGLISLRSIAALHTERTTSDVLLFGVIPLVSVSVTPAPMGANKIEGSFELVREQLSE
jgi:hypothetical protein